MQLKVGGKLHLKLNTGERPIANKYREGKMKSTLERELNQYVKLLKGKRLESSHVHCEFSLVTEVHFPVDGSASISKVRRGPMGM